MRELVFIVEPDSGRVTLESSALAASDRRTVESDFGYGTAVNCGRPAVLNESRDPIADEEGIHLYRIYHDSVTDGPGRRSVIQFAGCSIRCPGCYVPETHDRKNGRLTMTSSIFAEVEGVRNRHDGVTILGGEPFDQPEGLAELVKMLKNADFHLVIYTGYTIENLLSRKSGLFNEILAQTDLLIDGKFRKDMTDGAGEYRGSGNQRLIFKSATRNRLNK